MKSMMHLNGGTMVTHEHLFMSTLIMACISYSHCNTLRQGTGRIEWMEQRKTLFPGTGKHVTESDKAVVEFSMTYCS
jgi:hypothetical protein